jgi:hypothetical protein
MNILVTGGNGYVGRKLELGGFVISYRDSGDCDTFARALGKAQFGRLARPVACFRQTGLNNSGTNMPRTRTENAPVCTRHGPKPQLERGYGALLKA